MDFSKYKAYSDVTVASKSVNSAISYHNKYSWNDKFILEKTLYKLGYDAGSIDGIIDEDTIDAIKEFQRDNRLGVDGKAGDKTVDKMAYKLRE